MRDHKLTVAEMRAVHQFGITLCIRRPLEHESIHVSRTGRKMPGLNVDSAIREPSDYSLSKSKLDPKLVAAARQAGAAETRRVVMPTWGMLGWCEYGTAIAFIDSQFPFWSGEWRRTPKDKLVIDTTLLVELYAMKQMIEGPPHAS